MRCPSGVVRLMSPNVTLALMDSGAVSVGVSAAPNIGAMTPSTINAALSVWCLSLGQYCFLMFISHLQVLDDSMFLAVASGSLGRDRLRVDCATGEPVE